MLDFLKTAFALAFIVLNIIETTTPLTLRVINVNVASDTFKKNYFNELATLTEFTEPKEETQNLAAKKEAHNTPDVLVFALQEADISKMPEIPVSKQDKKLLSKFPLNRYINGYELVKSYGLAGNNTFIFVKDDESSKTKCVAGKEVVHKYDFADILSRLENTGATSGEIVCGSIVLQVVSLEQSTHTDNYLAQRGIFKKLHKKFLRASEAHVQIVTGNFQARTDIKNNLVLINEPVNSLGVKYNDPQVVNSSETDNKLYNYLKAADFDKKSTAPRHLKEATFETASNHDFVGFLLQYDQLSISMTRDIFFGYFTHPNIEGAPSYMLNKGDAASVDEIAEMDAQPQSPTQQPIAEGSEVLIPDSEILKSRSRYVSEPDMCWSDRIIVNSLLDLEESVKIKGLKTHLFPSLKTDHAVTSLELELKDTLFQKGNAKLKVVEKKMKLILTERFPGGIISSKKNIVMSETNNKKLRSEQIKQDRRIIKVIKILSEKVKNITLLVSEENQTSAEKESKVEPQTWETSQFNHKVSPNKVIKFKVQATVNGLKKIIDVKIWVKESEVSDNGIIGIGKGISASGKWILDVELVSVE